MVHITFVLVTSKVAPQKEPTVEGIHSEGEYSWSWHAAKALEREREYTHVLDGYAKEIAQLKSNLASALLIHSLPCPCCGSK